MAHRSPFALSALVVAATVASSPAEAQLPGDAYLVASDLSPGPVATRLFVVEANGAITSVTNFPSDRLAPQAVTVDPLTGDIIVIVTIPTPGPTMGHGRVLRLALSGQTVIAETVLGNFPGPVHDVAVMLNGDLFAAVTGPIPGIWSMPRRGGPPQLDRTFNRPTAFTSFGLGQDYLVVADSGAAGPPPRDLSVVSYAVVGGPTYSTVTHVGFQPSAVTGLLDLPTALVRTLFTHPDGAVSLSVNNQTPQPLQLPNLGPGTTRTMVWGPLGATGSGIAVLGGSAHPFIKSIPLIPQPGTPLPWTIVAGPLLGDPVDMDITPPDGASSWPFGQSCAQLNLGWFQRPVLGSSTFGLTLHSATPSSTALFVLGFSDATASGIPLPISLPSGCDLLVAPDAPIFATTDAQGFARWPLSIPNNPNLLGLYAYAQALQWPSTPFTTSNGMAIRIGR